MLFVVTGLHVLTVTGMCILTGLYIGAHLKVSRRRRGGGFRRVQVAVLGIKTWNFGIRSVWCPNRGIFLDFEKNIFLRKKIIKKPLFLAFLMYL